MKTTIETCDKNGHNAEPIVTFSDADGYDEIEALRDYILNNSGPEIENLAIAETTLPNGAAGFHATYLADGEPAESFYRLRFTEI